MITFSKLSHVNSCPIHHVKNNFCATIRLQLLYLSYAMIDTYRFYVSSVNKIYYIERTCGDCNCRPLSVVFLKDIVPSPPSDRTEWSQLTVRLRLRICLSNSSRPPIICVFYNNNIIILFF